MEDVSRYLGVNRTLSLICTLWIFSPAEGNTIPGVVGSRVILPCDNSNRTVKQLTWKKNGVLNLISFIPDGATHISKEAASLKINISLSDTQRYALIIESAQKSHTGNYTCDITASTGVWEQKWELIITEHEEHEGVNGQKRVIVVAATVTCVCCLIFIFALTCLRRINKRCAQNSNQSPTVEMEEIHDIYENHLEIYVHQQRNSRQPHYCKPRSR
ncbi:uncharacterized protein LOC121194056 isoform X2 [Toxotes jaculatrix]|uniref:uncharacterized protein LOC121194056 isoform X2 n=1 Tax=Toxotes jaculatrix TaxID=941984 RepID=UPI001B3A9C6F|nr:uncharacterized protein LOC121194056 isoform X2 [Toxotes jaculatrix]